MTHGLGSLGMNVRNFKHEMKNLFFFFFFFFTRNFPNADISPCFGPQANFYNLTDSRTREPRIYRAFTLYLVIGLFSAELDREIGPAQETVGTARQLVTG